MFHNSLAGNLVRFNYKETIEFYRVADVSSSNSLAYLWKFNSQVRRQQSMVSLALKGFIQWLGRWTILNWFGCFGAIFNTSLKKKITFVKKIWKAEDGFSRDRLYRFFYIWTYFVLQGSFIDHTGNGNSHARSLWRHGHQAEKANQSQSKARWQAPSCCKENDLASRAYS